MQKNVKVIGLFILSFIVTGHIMMAFGQIQQWPMVNANRENTSWASLENVLYPPLQETDILTVSGLWNVYYAELTWFDYLLCAGIDNSAENMFAMFDVTTGDTLWTFRVPSSGGSVGFVPAQNDSLVFCGGQDGTGLFALDRQTGQQKWFNPLGSLFSRHPILDEDHLYILKNQLTCLYISDGTVKWSLPFYGINTPAVDEQNCYVCSDSKVAAYNKINSLNLYSLYNSDENNATLTLYGDYLYTHTNDSLVARLKSTGQIQWVYPLIDCELSRNHGNNVAVTDSILCYSIRKNPDGNGRLLTLNRLDGSYRWHHDFTAEGTYTPTIANDVVYVVDWGGNDLYGFDLKTGAQLFMDSSHNYKAQPIVADHKLYIGSRDGVVVFENDDTGVSAKDAVVPQFFTLYQNYPNPFNPVTHIRYNLPEAGFVTLKVFDLLGQKVVTLISEEKTAGEYKVSWDASGFSSGIYLYQLEAGEFIETRKLILQK